MVGFDNSSFSSVNALDWDGPHVQTLDLHKSSQSGCVISARLGMNFPSWLAIPMNLLSSDTEVGALIFLIASVFSGSALIPSASIT